MDKLKLGKEPLPSLDRVSIHDLRRRVRALRYLKFQDFTQAHVDERVKRIWDIAGALPQ